MAKLAPIKYFSQPSPDKATFHTSGKPTGPPFVLTQNLSPRILLEVKLISHFVVIGG